MIFQLIIVFATFYYMMGIMKRSKIGKLQYFIRVLNNILYRISVYIIRKNLKVKVSRKIVDLKFDLKVRDAETKLHKTGENLDFYQHL